MATLRIDGSELNLFGTDTIATIREKIEAVPVNVSVLVIRGTDDDGKGGLTAGIPLDKVKDLSTTEARQMLMGLHRMIDAVRNLDAVTVCCCGEYALGAGLELAMSCDFRVATAEAKLGLPEINIGLVTGIQGNLLVRLVGLQKAKELVYTGKVISGTEAENIGLINVAVSPGNYEASIDALVGRLAEKSPLIIQMQTRVFRGLRSNGIESGIDASLETIAACFDTHDQTEAMDAFLESRDPSFVGQ
ncbi:Enoyl-CoA hydratase/isomerase [Halalkalicoccus jeotgali B3]|uniref:Enoyl-CoA hydratase/isomerase n=1 Tax=Halalkalicoccus jeotgali (strain DSM 18796 / CECT 7217 / JCM 14584 / KCTC 4019 / B3) TaxID=795797 RepID=D8JCU6_HALJB|nr:Enoyl-CoA hydratase/isomerase [Halalkalicoccus jeotgali B3]ELY38723.1 Enoyl-CoA hydratase/isomerase [Halalkalicoccus jeotgali B3]